MATARLLDLTRSMRRAGRGVTGVDRVERAYLTHLLEDDAPLFGLVRTPLGYLVLDADGLRVFQQRLAGQGDWGARDLVSRLARGRDGIVQRAESDLRRLAVARARRGRLQATLARVMPDGFDYFNLGHSNLTDRVLGAVKHAGGRVQVMVHDVIPLTHPQFQRPETIAPFEAKMRRVSAQADRVIYNSAFTKEQTEALFAKWGRVPPSIVSHLGTITPVPAPEEVPAHLPVDRPYFITVGTIEPRKNHAFLLDLWEEMGADAPPLFICGARGWNNDAVFARLDALPAEGPVFEVPNLSDGAIAALTRDAAGTLFPSLVEGYGLPPVEWCAGGARVLCNNLPVLGEILGDRPVYASVSDRYQWLKIIKNWEDHPPRAKDQVKFEAPSWASHFNTVLRLT